jgi:hypothetical protein
MELSAGAEGFMILGTFVMVLVLLILHVVGR